MRSARLIPGAVDGKLIGEYLLYEAVGIAPSFLFNTEVEVAQRAANAKVALALAAHRAERGRFPESLDDLRLRYLTAVPTDRFSGKSLVYRRTADGYLLYSVGPNGRDDGGRTLLDDDTGACDDLPIRVPLPPLINP